MCASSALLYVCMLSFLLQIIQFEKNVEQLKKKVSQQSRQQQVRKQGLCLFLWWLLDYDGFLIGHFFVVHFIVLKPFCFQVSLRPTRG